MTDPRSQQAGGTWSRAVRSRMRRTVAKRRPTVGGMPSEFDVRVAEWQRDLDSALAGVYPVTATAVGRRLVDAARAAHRRRPPTSSISIVPALRTRPGIKSRSGSATWPTSTASEATWPGVRRRIPHLTELGVDTLHLLSLLQPRIGESDGGYAIRDYLRPDSRLGTLDDLLALDRRAPSQRDQPVRRLRAQPHERRSRVGTRRRRAGPSTTVRCIARSPIGPSPTDGRRRCPRCSPTSAPGNFTWNESMQRWVWTTFREFQWDLDWSNPDVMLEVVGIALALANYGIEILRLDAIAFTWKRLGTNCQNQPEAHLVAQALRAVLAMAAPATVLLAEAIVGARRPRRLPRASRRCRARGSPNSGPARMRTRLPQPADGAGLVDAGFRTCRPGTNGDRTPDRHSAQGHLVHLRPVSRRHRLGDRRSRCSVGRPDAVRDIATTSRSSTVATSGSRSPGVLRSATNAVTPRRAHERHDGDAGRRDRCARRPTTPTRSTRAIDRILFLYGIAFGFGGVPIIYMGDELVSAGRHDLVDRPGPRRADSRWSHRPHLDDRLAGRSARPDDTDRSGCGRASGTSSRPAGAAARCTTTGRRCTCSTRAPPRCSPGIGRTRASGSSSVSQTSATRRSTSSDTPMWPSMPSTCSPPMTSTLGGSRRCRFDGSRPRRVRHRAVTAPSDAATTGRPSTSAAHMIDALAVMLGVALVAVALADLVNTLVSTSTSYQRWWPSRWIGRGLFVTVRGAVRRLPETSRSPRGGADGVRTGTADRPAVRLVPAPGRRFRSHLVGYGRHPDDRGAQRLLVLLRRRVLHRRVRRDRAGRGPYLVSVPSSRHSSA